MGSGNEIGQLRDQPGDLRPRGSPRCENFSQSHAVFLKVIAMDAEIPAEAKEMEREKSRFTVKLVVLVNAFLFSTCFFMENSIFPVSILGK